MSVGFSMFRMLQQLKHLFNIPLMFRILINNKFVCLVDAMKIQHKAHGAKVFLNLLIYR